MKLSEFCIKRPVFTLVLSFMLMIIGFVGYSRLELRDLPKMETPTVTVQTYYPGASAEILETQITRILEDSLASLEGLDRLRSQSRDEISQITVDFKANYDIEAGMNHVRDKVSQVVSGFPDEVEAPIITKADLNAQATLYVTFTDMVRSKMSLTDYVDTYIKTTVEQVEGVGDVQLWGARGFSVRIWPDPVKLSARGLTVQDIDRVIQTQNANTTGGKLEGNMRDYTIVPGTKLRSLDEFKQLIIHQEKIAHQAMGVVRLQDVAQVEIAPVDDRVFVKADGKPSLIMAVTPNSTANPVTVSREIIKYFQRLKPTLPQGMDLVVAYDNAVFINASIANVYETLVEAVILVVIVVFGFLGSIRGTTIPIVTIPICLTAIFGFLYFMGYSINNMTLLALVLAIGLVVDDAIVMLENIHRHIEKGVKPLQAAFLASKEIGFAIVAMTLTLVAVYAPIAFVEGVTGSVFKEFAFALAGTVLISGFVALTLSPMMCARVLPAKAQNSAYSRWIDNKLLVVRQFYQRCLALAIKFRTWVLLVVILLAATGAYVATTLQSELAPTEDIGGLMAIMMAPSGANIDYIAQQTDQLEAIWQQVEGKKSFVVVGGVPISNQAFSFLSLQPWQERQQSQKQIMAEIMPKLMAIPGALAFPIEPPALPISGDSPVEFIVQISGSYQELAEIMSALQQDIAENNPNLQGVRVNLDMDTPKVRLTIRRDVAADLQVDPADVMETISVLMGGRVISEFESDAKNYDIKVQLTDSDRRNVRQLQDIYVRNKQGDMIPLTNLIAVTEEVGAQSLSHYNRLRAAVLEASLLPGYTQSDAVHYLEAAAKRLLGNKAQYEWGGQTREYLQSGGSMIFTIVLALLFIYLVLAAQFESFIDPLIIMLTVPFSIVGAVLLLKITGGTNNLYTQIGFVTLIGLVTKHGILITEFANQLRHSGMALQEAVIQAAGTRLRPILMTTGAMVLGAMPLALATGAGAYARQQLGWTIVGGMTVGTVFSLLVVPLAYTLLSRVTLKDRQ